MNHTSGPFDPLEERLSDERTLLLAFLDDSRAEFLVTIEGLTDEQARQRLVPSLTCPLSLLKHLVYVETVWFQATLTGRARSEVGIPESSEEYWVLSDQDSLAGLGESFRRACEESRRIVTSYDLDHRLHHPRMGEMSLRFLLLHVIREHARHAGHADILREQILTSEERS